MVNLQLKRLLPAVVLGASTAACLGLGATQAQASILVDGWTATVRNGFCTFAGNTTITPSVPGTVPTASYLGTDCTAQAGQLNPNLGTTISWGTPATLNGQQSSLSISPTATSNLLTGMPGAFVPSSILTHENFPIFGTLQEGTIVGLLDLDATSSADPSLLGPIFDDSPAVFGLNFIETANAEPCVVPPGAGGPCPDIFVLTQLTREDGMTIDLTSDTPLTFPVSNPFQVGSYEYELLLQIQGVTALTAAQCEAAGAVSNCIGFTTEEGRANTFNTALAINKIRQVRATPEPGSLGLLAAGMASLGLLGKRKKAE